MLERGSGDIVVISSLQGKLGLPFRSSCEPTFGLLVGSEVQMYNSFL